MRIDISNRIGTTSNFGGFRGLLDKFSGAAAGYSLRKLSKSATNAVRVRRSSDNTEQDIGFTGTELDTTTLLDFVNARDVAPADYGAGAAAAYSLRYVSDSYTGDVVRVRRDSDNAEADFNPTEITDGTLLAWVGNTASDNGYVTTWYDQSGNSNDATQGTAASQPKIVDAGVLVEENGKPAVDFDGSDDILETISGLSSSAASGFVVYTPNFNGTSNVVSPIDIGSSSNVGYWPFDFAIFDDFASSSRNLFTPSVMPFTNGNQSLVSIINDNTNKYFYVDSIIQNTVSDSISFATTIKIGGSSSGFSNCKIQDIILYNSDQSSNRGNIEANVNDYYSIYTSTNDGFVTTWYDQSGNANNATQATAASQPQIVDGGSLITENGKPAVDFDGVDDFFTAPNNATLQIIGDMSTFVVANYQSNTGALDIIFSKRIDDSNREFEFRYDTDSPNFELRYLDSNNSFNESIATLDQKLVGYDRIQDTSVEIFINGAGQGSNALSGTQAITTADMTIGARDDVSNLANATIQELILYPSDQSGNRTAIEGNINGHYNIYP